VSQNAVSPRSRHLTWAETRAAVLDCTVLAVACLITYWLVTRLLSQVWFISKADDLLGRLWAVIATVFVCRDSYQQSMTAAVSRMAATTVSFLLCLVYLVFLPFHAWALALLIGVSAAVVMIVAAVTPHDAWEQPILRFADTLIGVVVGVAAAWVGLRLLRPRIRRG
jgi:uncharacterized membrane protein YgaE (UPF0421/DUF939 family)